MDRIEKIIGKVNGSMAIEGMPLNKIDKDNIRQCLSGKVKFDDMVKSLVEKYRQPEKSLVEAADHY